MTVSHKLCLALMLAVPACALENADDANQYREAVPVTQSVSVSGPDSASGSSTKGLGDAPSGTAEWYRFTRNVRDGVNVVTAEVLVGVWAIVHTRPTEVGADYAEWGPHTDALEPVTYRFRVDRVADHEYNYKLEGRPKSSKSDADFIPVLTGNGFDKLDPRHGDGSFTIDLDAAKQLDPDRHQNDSGTVKITHDLPPTITEQNAALPRTISAELRPQGEAWIDITSVAKEDETGTLAVNAHADTDDSKMTKLEDVTVNSQWRADGAGRADVSVSGGDLPTTIPVVDATECWGSDFARVYYEDTVGFENTYGDASACVYTQSSGS